MRAIFARTFDSLQPVRRRAVKFNHHAPLAHPSPPPLGGECHCGGAWVCGACLGRASPWGAETKWGGGGPPQR